LQRDAEEIIRVGQCQGYRSYGDAASLFRIALVNSDGVYSVWDFKKWARA
jgi:hypothetical protein